MHLHTEVLPGDLEMNCIVDVNDLMLFSNFWLSDSEEGNLSPSDGNEIVNLDDLAVFSEFWLQSLYE